MYVPVKSPKYINPVNPLGIVLRYITDSHVNAAVNTLARPGYSIDEVDPLNSIAGGVDKKVGNTPPVTVFRVGLKSFQSVPVPM